MTVGTTVTIDGNSTGLVDSLDKAKTAVKDVQTEAVKLSKQFKDVADDADKAAGSFVQSLGGGAVIKAVGGIGVAMGGVKVAVDAVLGSADALFSTMGEDGARASAEINTKMAEFGSTLVKVVTGSGDLETVQRRLNLLIDGAISVWNALISPLVTVSDLYWKLIDDTDDLTDATTKLNAARAQNAKIVNETTQKDMALGDKMSAAMQTALTALGKENELRDLLNEKQAAALRQTREEAKEMFARNLMLRENEEIQALADSSEPKTLQDNIRIQERASHAAQIYMGVLQERADVLAKLDPQDREFLDTLNAAAKAYDTNTLADNKHTAVVQTNSHSRTQAISDEEAKKRREAEENERKRREEEDRKKREEDEARRQRLEDAQKEADEIMRLRNEGVEIVRENLKKEADEKKAARQLDFDAVVGQNAKMLAIAIVNKKKASDVARAIVGNTVQAYGDAAMVKAGIEAADGNWTQAAQLTAAGFAAYLTAAALGADQKSKGATPPTQKAAPVQNYSYSLRVDAAFADGEAVSRHFARMQDGARQRGLIGAT